MPKRGFYRRSARHPEGAQKRMLTEAGYTLLYTESDKESAEDFVASLRKGEVFGVPTLGRLASARTRLRDLLKAILTKGAVLHEVATNRRSDNPHHLAVMPLDAADELGADRQVHNHGDAVRFGKKGGRPKIERMDADEARIFWYNVKRYPRPEDALQHMIGWSRKRAFDLLGGRLGVKGIGRPRKSRK